MKKAKTAAQWERTLNSAFNRRKRLAISMSNTIIKLRKLEKDLKAADREWMGAREMFRRTSLNELRGRKHFTRGRR